MKYKKICKILLITQLVVSMPIYAQMQDGGFENGLLPASAWTPTSTFGGIVNFPLCGAGNGCPADGAMDGNWFAWIGGLAAGITSHVSQDITIGAGVTNVTATVLRGICDDPSDTITFDIDGTVIGSIACTVVDTGAPYSFSVGAFNDGGVHTLTIGGTVGGTNGTHSNFFVDLVGLDGVVPVELMNFSVE